MAYYKICVSVVGTEITKFITNLYSEKICLIFYMKSSFLVAVDILYPYIDIKTQEKVS